MATIELETSPQSPASAHLAPAVREVLGRLRGRVRRYVWLEGLAAAVAWLGIAFWLSLAIDWLLEPPPVVNAMIVVAAVLVLAAVLVRLIGRRAFVRLTDGNMATLLERRFPKLNDALLTSVVLGSRDASQAGYDPQMFSHTCREAAENISEVRLPQVFDPLPLRRKMAAAVALATSVIAFALLVPGALEIWGRRVFAGDQRLWPRKISLEVDPAVFKDGKARVAKGSDLEVVVRALRGDADEVVVPDDVEVRYQIEGGQRGRAAMVRIGERRTEGVLQEFSHTFRGILAPHRFEVVGGDARTPKLEIEVVDNPVLTDVFLVKEFPAYMERPLSDPVPVSGAMQVPLGTRVTVCARSNKELVKVRIEVPGEEGSTGGVEVLEGDKLDEDRQGFSWALPPLTRDTTLRISLSDADGITSREPYPLALVAVSDEPPQVAVRLAGIGSSITPQARLPLGGRVTDDYGTERVWAEYAVNEKEAKTVPLPLDEKQRKTLAVQHPADYALAETVLEAADMKLKPEQKLLLTVKAEDRSTVGKGRNVGAGERWLLDVVTPDQLRALLEGREMVLRQRFEGIIAEVEDTNRMVGGMDFAVPGEKAADRTPGLEPGEKPAPKPKVSPAEQLARRSERVGQALENCRKNAHETLGVAEAFDDILAQYLNNRIDTDDPAKVSEKRRRLGHDIARPLHDIAEKDFPELEKRLVELQAAVADLSAGSARRNRAMEQISRLLIEMDTVKKRMLELEDYNRIVGRLRDMIEELNKLNEQTKKKQKETIRGLLEDK